MKLLRKFIKITIILILVFIFLLFGLTAYYKNYKYTYSDIKYGFIIKDQKGWYSIPKQEGVYYSIGTGSTSTNNNFILLSYFGIVPQRHIVDELNDKLKKSTSDSCYQTESDQTAKVISFSETTLNNLIGYLCITEGKPNKSDKIYIQKFYTLINKPGSLYDYIITVSYPKEDIQEEIKVNKILRNFYAK